MSGTKISQFEGHIAEIMWRSVAKGNIYNEFFSLLKAVYNLEGPPKYLYTTPLFDSWNGGKPPVIEQNNDNEEAWTINAIISDAESGNEASGTVEDMSHHGIHGPAKTSTCTESASIIISDDEHNDTLIATPQPACTSSNRSRERITNNPTKTTGARKMCHTPCQKQPSLKLKLKKKTVNRTDKVCHPPGFVEKNPSKSDKSGSSKAERINQYSKDAYKWEFSSDDDFQ